jgi:bla regulator protein blaR1
MFKKRTTILLLLMTVCALSVAAHAQRDQDSKWTWQHRDDDRRLEVTIRGKVEFTEDYTDIKSIPAGGSIRITDERGGTRRKFEAEQTSSGIKRSYSVDGEPRPLDSQGQAWLATILQETIIQGGYDAGPRARRILSERGPSALLDEISKLRSDYVKRMYFEVLVSSGSLDARTARRALEQAGREMKSDYEKANVLMKAGEDFLDDEAVQGAYLTAVGTIDSSYERGRVLATLLKRSDLSDRALLLTLRIAGGISSDYERTQVLLRVAERPVDDHVIRSAYLAAAATIQSDYEQCRALSALLKKKDLEKETIVLTIKSAAGISSDHEKAQLLIRAAQAGSGDEAVRNALVETARTIKSEYERGRVLNAVFK